MRGVDGTSEFLRARSHKRVASFVAVFAAIIALFPVAPANATDQFEPARTCAELPIVDDAPTDSTVATSSTTTTLPLSDAVDSTTVDTTLATDLATTTSTTITATPENTTSVPSSSSTSTTVPVQETEVVTTSCPAIPRNVIPIGTLIFSSTWDKLLDESFDAPLIDPVL